MEDTKVKRKSREAVHKVAMYKETAVNAIQKVTEFDSLIIASNDEYLDKLQQADSFEYEILKINMEKAETETERIAIRTRIAEMKRERYSKDAENKGFYEKQQSGHKNYTLQVLGSVAVVAGLVAKYRKPLMTAGQKLIMKR